jgi:alpha-glucoside transport system substrate-binding protein
MDGRRKTMTRSRRWRAFMAVAAAVSLLAAACGDGGEEGEATGDLEGQTVEVAAVWSGSEQERFQMILDAFAEETGAETKFTSTGDDIAAVLGPRVEAGDPPDVAMLPQPGLVNDYVEQGALIPIDDVAGDEVDENLPATYREVFTFDDQLYGVFFKAANKSTMWYSVPVFQNAGVEPPADWDALQQTAQTISDFGVTPYAIGGGDAWPLSDWFENIYIRTAGPEMYDQLARHEIPWTDQSVKDALGVFAEVVGDDQLLAGGASGVLQTGFEDSVAQVFADPQNPEAAIVYEGDFVAGIITGETDSQVGTDADFFTFPSIDGSEPAVVSSGDTAVLMKDSEAGKALIEFLATPEAGEIWAREGGFISPSLNVDPSVYPDDITRRAAEALVEAGENARYDLSDLQPAEFGATTGEGIWGLLQEFVRNPDDVDGITQQLEDEANRAYGGG